MIDLKEIYSLLKEISGFADPIFFEKKEIEASLPVYLSYIYKLTICRIFGRQILLAVIIKKDRPTVIEITRHAELLKSKTGFNVVFVFEELDTKTRQRLYKRHIAFIESNKTVYLPFLFLKTEFSNGTSAKQFDLIPTKLDRLSEIILINQICWKSMEGLSGIELARKFEVTQMSISRALNSLYEQKLCYLKKENKNKRVFFDEPNELWYKASGFLSSPLETIVYAQKIPNHLESFTSGISALSEQSLLADDNFKTVAVSKKSFLKLKELKILEAYSEQIKFKIEVWNRDPKWTSQNKRVDPLSLYLIFKNDIDERVQIAVEEMLNRNNLKFIL